MKGRQASARRRSPAKRRLRSIKLCCDASDARDVRLVGDFNDWDLAATPLQRISDGRWTANLKLEQGHYDCLLVVDGDARLDPNASGTTEIEGQDRVSLLSVK